MNWRWPAAVCLAVAGGVVASKLVQTRQQAAPLFCGYQCTKDCSGHEAGYRWAQRKALTSRRHCSGNSQSFIEGCLAYVEGCRWR